MKCKKTTKSILKSRIIMWVIPLLFGLPLMLSAQKREVTGTVTDEANETLPGVSVTIKGTTVGVTTNDQGKFSINADQNDILVISYIGYIKQEIRVGNQSIIDIIMKSADNSLDDVVVVGYTSRLQRDIGGAVIRVDNKVLKDRPVSNTLSALQGAAPGLVITRTNGQPGREGWSAQIRGITSLGAGNSPLVIIDGVEGDINVLNPNDIQELTVLQDAASASIYGAKAGGGVILVTTKSGKPNQKTKFDLNMMYTFRTPFARPETLSSREEAVLQNAAAVNGGGAPAFNDQQLAWLDDPNVDYVLNPNTNQWEYFYNYNMQNLTMREQSPQKNINFTASGGGDKSSFLFSMGLLDEQGVFKFGPDNFSRFNSRINYNTRLTKMFTLDTRLSFVKSRIMAPSRSADGASGLMYDTYSIRASRNPIYTPGTENSENPLYAFVGTLSQVLPILKDGGFDKTDKYDVSGVISLSAKQVLKGLDLRAVYSPTLSLINQTVFEKTVPRWTVDQNLNPIPGNPIYPVNSYKRVRPFYIDQSFFTTADYDYKTDLHSFHVLGGFEYKKYQYDEVQAIQRALLLNNFPTLNYTSLSNADVSNVSDNIQINTWLSYFARASYNYKSKYYAEGTIRRDGSSRLAPGFKFHNFYSANLFWRVSQEDWFNTALPWINEFKVTASYGTLGGAQTSNRNANNYDFQSPLSSSFYPFNDAKTILFYQGVLPSDSKAWEVIETSNIGFDLEVLRNRLRFHFDYFVKNNNNVFVAQQLPALLGVTPNSANLAAVQVKGWGVTLNWNDRFKNGSYYFAANLSDDKNKVTRFDGSVSYNTGINAALPGLSTNSIFGFKADGYFNSQSELQDHPVRLTTTSVGDIKLIDVNGDGQINTGLNTAENHGDLVYLGNSNPRYVFGLSGGVNWKGFDVSVLFNGVGKRNVLIQPANAMAFYSGWIMPWKIHQDYWTPENQDAKFPRILIGDRINDVVSSHWVQNASYIRLKNLQVGYTLAQDKHKLKALGDVRLYFSGQDLWEKTGMWFNYYDPENTNNIGYGYPLWRSYAIGLNIGF